MSDRTVRPRRLSRYLAEVARCRPSFYCAECKAAGRLVAASGHRHVAEVAW